MEPIVTLEEFSDRIPDGIAQEDTARAFAMLADASTLVRAEGVSEWTIDDAPDIAKMACMSAAKRAFLNPDGVTNLALDGASAGFANASSDIYLTAAERRAIHKAAGLAGVWTLGTTRTDADYDDDTGRLDTPGVLSGMFSATEEELETGPLEDFFP